MRTVEIICEYGCTQANQYIDLSMLPATTAATAVKASSAAETTVITT